jgi:hypothetical protein
VRAVGLHAHGLGLMLQGIGSASCSLSSTLWVMLRRWVTHETTHARSRRPRPCSSEPEQQSWEILALRITTGRRPSASRSPLNLEIATRSPSWSLVCFRNIAAASEISRGGEGPHVFPIGARAPASTRSCAAGFGDPIPFPPQGKIWQPNARTGRYSPWLSTRLKARSRWGLCRERERRQRPGFSKKSDGRLVVGVLTKKTGHQS